MRCINAAGERGARCRKRYLELREMDVRGKGTGKERAGRGREQRERVGVGEEVFHAADFKVRMTAKVFVSMMGKVDFSGYENGRTYYK